MDSEIPARFLSGEFLAPVFRRMLRSPELSPLSADVLGFIGVIHYMPKHVTAPHPVCQDGTNPTRAGRPLALDREIPLPAFVATELSRISSK